MTGRLIALCGAAALFACEGASEGPGGSGAAGAAGADGADAGSGTGGSAGAIVPKQPVSVTPPPVDFPDRPQWESGPPAKAPGWRDSVEPFCSPWVGDTLHPSIWSTPSTVYVLLTMTCQNLINSSCSTEQGTYQSLFVNDGGGWTAVGHWSGFSTLYAFGTLADGSLVSTGMCAAGKFDLNGGFECLGNRGVASFGDAFIRDGTVHHLSMDTLGVSALATYANQEWVRTQTLGPGQRPEILLDLGGEVVLAGMDGLVLRGNIGGPLREIESPSTGNFVAGTALPGGDFALSDDTGRVALNLGGVWSTLALGPDQPVVWAMRSSPSGSIYALAGQKLYRIRRTGAAELLLQLSGYAYFNSIAVNSDTEIFLGINDYAFSEFKCDSTILGWYDGTDFRLF